MHIGSQRDQYRLLALLLAISTLIVSACDHPPDDRLIITSNAGTGTIKLRVNQLLLSGHVLAPGVGVTLQGFAADLQDVTRVEMGLYNFVTYSTGAVNFYGTPDFYPMSVGATQTAGPFLDFVNVSLSLSFGGAPPSPAFIRVTYRDASNQEKQVSIGEYVPLNNQTPAHPPAFVFIPNYEEYIGVVDIPIGSNLFGHTVEDTVFPVLSGPARPFFEENYFRLRRVSLQQTASFEATSLLWLPCAQTNWLRQGYRIIVPPNQSGTVTMIFHVAAPKGMLPPAMNLLDGYELAGSFAGSVFQGLPNVGLVEFSDSGSSLPAPIAEHCT